MRQLAPWLFLSALAGSDAAAQELERFSLAGTQVAVFNLAGEVRVERATGSEVVVEVVRHGADADRLAIRTGVSDGWRALRVVYPDDNIVYPRLGRSRTEFDVDSEGMFGGRLMRATLDADGFSIPAGRTARAGKRVRITGRGSGLEAYADLRVLVPDGRTVALHLGVGRVDLANLHGNIRIDARSAAVTAAGVNGSLLIATGSGGVSVTETRGHVRIDTGSGSVRADNVSAGSLVIDTGSGGVNASALDLSALGIDTGSGSIQVETATAPELRLNTGSGSIRANRISTRDVDLETGSGSIVLDLLTDIRNARLDTGSGGVTVYMPRQLGAEFVIDTGNGAIDVDTPVQITEKRRSHLRGRMGDGQGVITIGTGSGSIKLRTR